MKTTKLVTFTLVLCAAFALFSCGAFHAIEGNHQPTTEIRNLPSFSKLEVNGSYNVGVYSDSVFRVEIEAESNLLQHIQTYVYSGKLYIETAEDVNLREHYPITIKVFAPDMDYLSLNGSGKIYCQNLYATQARVEINGSGNITAETETDFLRSEISGSGDITLTGHCNHSQQIIEGSGRIYASNLEQDSCDARISGSGRMNLYVIKYLKARIDGSGQICYEGYPSTSVNINGSGSVSHP